MHSAFETPSAVADAVRCVELTVIIVNYNVRPFLEQALSSVTRACEGIESEIFVVDNNSVDGSAEMVRARFPGVRLLVNEENVGFARANNQAIRQARGRFLLVLNPDTIVQEDSIAKMLGFMARHPSAGAVGCQILNPDGSFAPESRRTYPTPSVAFYRITGLSRLFPRSRVFGRYNLTYLPRDQVAEVDALSGSCMMVRRTALAFSAEQTGKLEADGVDPVTVWAAAPEGMPEGGEGGGLLDEDFFMYGEDLDWCYRIQKAGWKIFYTPETQIIHYKGESTKQGELRYVRLFYGAMLQFISKHFHGRYSRVFALMMRAGIFLRAGMSLAGTALRGLSQPAAEVLVSAVVLAGAGLFAAWVAGKTFPSVFYSVVTPAYALLTVGCIALAGGYRRGATHLIRPLLTGIGAAFLTVSVLSFFVRSIAYSRAMVILGFGGTLAALAVIRWSGRSRSIGRRRALFVGRIQGARRLQRLLAGQADPPLELAGYVPPDEAAADTNGSQNALPRLGTIRQLRDVVRLRGIDEVVFSAPDVSNQTMFRLVQQLRGLQVHFKVLAQDASHLIGKASIDDLSTPMLVGADSALGKARPYWIRRAFEVLVSIVLLASYPMLRLGIAIGRDRKAASRRRVIRRVAGLLAVIRGEKTLVGFDPEAGVIPPDDWRLKPGVFPVVAPGSARLLTEEELQEAYWLYARNQSAVLDLGILLRRLRAGE